MQLFIIQILILLVVLGLLVAGMAVGCVRSAKERITDEKTDLFQDAEWEREDD